MRLAFMAHPVAGDVKANVARAKRWMRYLIDRYPDKAIVAPWISYCEVLDDADPEQRKRGMWMNFAQLRNCHEVIFVGGEMTEGMNLELGFARALGIDTINFTSTMGKEPPQ